MIIEPLEFIKGPFTVAPGRVIEARVYQGGAPAVSGGVYGLDTETELITSKAFTPPLVIIQVSDGAISELVPYERAAEYMSYFDPNKEKFLFGVFNVGFDMSVVRDCWPHMMDAMDKDMVVDVGLRSNLLDISTRGFTAKGERLDTLVSRKLRFEISKDESVRLTYTRDMTLSRKHIKYGAIDAAVTRWLMDAILPQPTEFIQTRAGYALSEISRNGLLIDRPEFDKLRAKLLAEMAEDAERLKSFGFNPDSSLAPKDHKESLARLVGCSLRDLTGARDIKALIGLILAAMEARDQDDFQFLPRAPSDQDLKQVGAVYMRWMGGDVKKVRNKSDPRLIYETFFDEFVSLRAMEDLAQVRKVGALLQAALFLLDQFQRGVGLEEAAGALKLEYEKTACWDSEKWAKPVAFLQERIRLLEETSKIEMPRTEGGSKYESGRKLLSVLKLNGIKDQFFDVFVRYKHNEKLLGTYLKPEDIGEDGRWHTRFTAILRTGRTSSSKPNAQNLPRKDGIRRLVVAPPGMVLVAIDYNQLELCTLAEHCYLSYGHSRLMEIINLGVDVHRWLGAKASGVLTDADDLKADAMQEQATALNEWLKTVVDKELRGFAKIGNFGLPGGMIGKTFFQHCLLNGVKDMTLERAEWLRGAWLKFFPEMNDHLNKIDGVIEVDEHNSNADERKLFESKLVIYGLKRAHCTRNAAANFRFQGLAAVGAKIAMWALLMAGARIVNFVHDEFIFEIPEDRMDIVPLYAEIMETSMRAACPDVTIRTESTAMRRWDKAAHSEMDEDGMLSIYEEEEE